MPTLNYLADWKVYCQYISTCSKNLNSFAFMNEMTSDSHYSENTGLPGIMWCGSNVFVSEGIHEVLPLYKSNPFGRL